MINVLLVPPSNPVVDAAPDVGCDGLLALGGMSRSLFDRTIALAVFLH